MRYFTLVALVMGASFGFSGCDFGRSRELTAQLQLAEAEKQMLRAENEKVKTELEATKKRIEELEAEVGNVNKLKELLSDAKKKLPGLLGKYKEGIGDGLNIAKELGLPELKDVPVESLLKNLLGDEKEDDQEKEKEKAADK